MGISLSKMEKKSLQAIGKNVTITLNHGNRNLDEQAMYDELAGIYEFEQNLSREQAELNAKMDMVKKNYE